MRSPNKNFRRLQTALALTVALPFAVDASAETPQRVNSQPVAQSEKTTPEPTAAERDAETRRRLNQLEFQFETLKRSEINRAARLLEELAPLLTEAAELAETPTDDARLAENARNFLTQLEKFQALIDGSRLFFQTLESFDAASVDGAATRDFLTRFEILAPATEFEPPEIADFRRDLASVAKTLDALAAVDDWNAFVDENGAALERFFVDAELAETALRFLSQNETRQGVPLEIAALKRRVPEWRFAAQNRVAARRKIVLALTAELETPYWTFAKSPDEIFYLKRPPRAGRNELIADALGRAGTVEIPENAPETRTENVAQRVELQELKSLAEQIPESLRTVDVAGWYAAWSDFFKRLQTAETLDPIVQFRLLQKTARTLAASDFYFDRRFAPILRVLNAPEFANDVDERAAQSVETARLRRSARTRVAFLPNPDDYLKVDKTTERLDAGVEKFAFQYRRVGWLAQDFSGAWRLRSPDDITPFVGDLYVLRADENSTVSDAAPRLRWLKIGTSDGRRATIQLAATNVWRGSVVFCRTRPDAKTAVAPSNENRLFFRR